MILAGRGFGKTRAGSEWIRKKAADYPGCRIALIAETAADARDVMILGDSGLINCDPTLTESSWSPSNRCLTWPNGSKAWVYNATEPDQLRGPQHHFAWVDELAKFRKIQEVWDQMIFGLRLGEKPKVLITTTPQPKQLIKKLAADDKRTVITRGSTMDNAANMSQDAVEAMYERYAGTRLGRQELEGEILGDIPGALWAPDMFDENRIDPDDVPEDMERIYVAVDPAASSEEGADEHGIVVVGMARDADGYARGYVLEDATCKGRPEEWAKAAVRMYRKHRADKIIAEKNNGGEMVESVIQGVDRTVPVKLVHATRGKAVRAEPISLLYEKGRIHHVGRFDKLEDQMCSFSVDFVRSSSEGSPDRVDALVWGFTEIFDKLAGRRKQPQGPRGSSSSSSSGNSSGSWDPGPSVHTSNPQGWMAG